MLKFNEVANEYLQDLIPDGSEAEEPCVIKVVMVG
jgi:hypothetical protein